jgi:hypothetical protein
MVSGLLRNKERLLVAVAVVVEGVWVEVEVDGEGV